MKRPLMVVSNRLPIVVQNESDGSWDVKPASGGLVSALRPILREYGGAWVGWPGAADGAPLNQLLEKLGAELGCRFIGVNLSQKLVEGFYYGFSNETLWPLFHDLLGHARFEREKWDAYCGSNRRFAEVLARTIEPDSVVWVNDYQLLLVSEFLREQGVTNPIASFLHIPFPAPDIFSRLPWRERVIRAMLANDLIGFQTLRDLRNFIACVRHFISDANVEGGRQLTTITTPQTRVRVGAFPISIDYAHFDRSARGSAVEDAASHIHDEFQGQQILLGVDRLDYTKGLLVKFRSFERALEKYPDLHRRVTLLQIVIPSRQDIPEYAQWKARMDQAVGEINGRFASRGWMPLHYMYRSVTFTELLAYYRASAVCLVTPLKDGMNLVCKEYCAASVDENGVLILSEFAGAATQLREDAIVVNPHDTEAMADAFHSAVTMEAGERRERMRRLRHAIKRNNVFRWVKGFLECVSEPAAYTRAHGAGD
jgi:trehalose 6-phosphate synthase/phosphatase